MNSLKFSRGLAQIYRRNNLDNVSAIKTFIRYLTIYGS